MNLANVLTSLSYKDTRPKHLYYSTYKAFKHNALRLYKIDCPHHLPKSITSLSP